MSTEVKETAKPKKDKTNRIGLLLGDYKGAPSTLCAGCGHDAITSSIVKACFEMGVEPYNVAKLSGIGCSSKTPNYFLNQAHGFNSVHGRMAPIATGSSIANRQLLNIGVSGDGDTASIGLGNFLHMIRRNVNMTYIVENNGVYGLTKGQFSATAEIGSVKKGGKDVNALMPVDICAMAIEMGCGFVARSFSGDTNQVRNLIKAAMQHEGTALLDIISPCVTFNNHEGSTKSVTYAREHEDPLHEIDFTPAYEQITVEYEEGTSQQVRMHDGSTIMLKKVDTHEYDPTDMEAALSLLHEAEREHHFYTGLIYFNGDGTPFDEDKELVEEPLAHIPLDRLVPSNDTLAEIMQGFR